MAFLTAQHHLPGSADPPRVHLGLVRFHHTLLDGSWWPRSGDLTTELRALVPALDQLCGPVARLLLGAAGWTARPREIVTGDRRVTVSYLAGQSPSMMTVHCTDDRTFTLLVTPPGPPPGGADGPGGNLLGAGGGGLGPPRG